MGADRSGARPAIHLRTLIPPERLYGRVSGHTLRPRQRLLLDQTLPRLRADPADPFAGWTGLRWLEVGAGGGEHALALSAANPEAMLVACEVFRPGLCSLLSRLVPEGGEASAPLPVNLRIWDDDARQLLRALPDGCLDRLFLLFPDPWPKSRHAKRRFVHQDRIPELARVLRLGGEWRIASDDPTYKGWVADVLKAQSLFDVTPPVNERPAGWPPTRYEAKARAAGRRPLYWSLRRGADPAHGT